MRPRAQFVDEVFCIAGFVDARRDCSRPVGTPRDHVQRGAKRTFNRHRKRNRTFGGTLFR
jgi:hypothetical protein